MGQAAFQPLSYVSVPYVSFGHCSSGKRSKCVPFAVAWAQLDIVLPTAEQIRDFSPEERKERFIFWAWMFSGTLLLTLMIVELMRLVVNQYAIDFDASEAKYRPIATQDPQESLIARGSSSRPLISVSSEEGEMEGEMEDEGELAEKDAGFKEAADKGIKVPCHHHRLKKFDNGSTSWYCDNRSPACTRHSEGPTVRWSCRDCGYDQCRGCVEWWKVYAQDDIVEEETHTSAAGAAATSSAGYQVEDVFFVAYMMLYISVCFAIVEWSILQDYLSLDVGLDYEYYFLLFVEAMLTHLLCAAVRCRRHVRESRASKDGRQEEPPPLPSFASKVPTSIIPVSSEKLEMLRDIVTLSIYMQEGYFGCAATATLGILLPNGPIFMDAALTANIRDAYWPILSVQGTQKKKGSQEQTGCASVIHSMLVEMDGLTREHRLYLALLEDGLQLLAGAYFTFSQGVGKSSKFVLLSASLSAAKLTFVYFARKYILCWMARYGIPWDRLTVRDVLMCAPGWAASRTDIFNNMKQFLEKRNVAGDVRAAALSHLAQLYSANTGAAEKGEPGGSTIEGESLTDLENNHLEQIFAMMFEALEDPSIKDDVVQQLHNAKVDENKINEYVETAHATHVLRSHNEAMVENPGTALERLSLLGNRARVAFVPLLKCLEDPNPDLRQAAAEAMSRLQWDQLDDSQCNAAMKAFSTILLRDRLEIRRAALAALGAQHISRNKDAALHRILYHGLSSEDESDDVKLAGEALAKFQGSANPTLLDVLGSKQGDEKDGSSYTINITDACKVRAITMLEAGAANAPGDQRAAIVAALLMVINDYDASKDYTASAEVRESAIRALGSFGSDASPALDCLQGILEQKSKTIQAGEDSDGRLRSAVVATLSTLARLQGTAASVIPTLQAIINLDNISYNEASQYLYILTPMCARSGTEAKKHIVSRVLKKIRSMTLELADGIRREHTHVSPFSPGCFELLDFDADAVGLDDLGQPVNKFRASASKWAQAKGKGRGRGKNASKGKGSGVQEPTEDNAEPEDISSLERQALDMEYWVAVASFFAMGFLGVDTAPLSTDLTQTIVHIRDLGLLEDEPLISSGSVFVLSFAGQVSDPLPAIEAMKGCMDEALGNGNEVIVFFAVMALGEFGRWQKQIGRERAIDSLRSYVSSTALDDVPWNMQFHHLLSGSLRILGHTQENDMSSAGKLIKELASALKRDAMAAACVLFAMKGFRGEAAQKCMDVVKPIVEKGKTVVGDESIDPILYYSACRTYIDLCRGLGPTAVDEYVNLLQELANGSPSEKEIQDYFADKPPFVPRIFAKAALREFRRRPELPQHM
eukprot:TRINITY_DN21424_c0_g1_i1.p1 TRINITY_DN21424_c0_g1~~TRINITY_DN21424_c0_g1_i1.p1  ORF type:complete len:1329 (-),score=180.19 TRINITY_DN21424_c0_g1_i1:145-4131(-)